MPQRISDIVVTFDAVMGSRLVGNSESVTDSIIPIAADHTAIREQAPVFRHHFLGIHSKEDLHKV